MRFTRREYIELSISKARKEQLLRTRKAVTRRAYVEAVIFVSVTCHRHWLVKLLQAYGRRPAAELSFYFTDSPGHPELWKAMDDVYSN